MLYFKANKPHFFFRRIPVVLENRRSSQARRGLRTPCTLPLDPPLVTEPIPEKGLVLKSIVSPKVTSGWIGTSYLQIKIRLFNRGSILSLTNYYLFSMRVRSTHVFVFNMKSK